MSCWDIIDNDPGLTANGGAAMLGLLHVLNVVLMLLFRLGARDDNVASNNFVRFREGCIEQLLSSNGGVAKAMSVSCSVFRFVIFKIIIN
jgi:hypothetical protein